MNTNTDKNENKELIALNNVQMELKAKKDGGFSVTAKPMNKKKGKKNNERR